MTRNVLVLHPTWPRPDQSAGDYQLVQLIRLLRQAGHAVTVAGRDRLPDPAQRAHYGAQLQTMGCDLVELFPHPSANTRWGSDLARKSLRTVVERNQFDAALVSFWVYAQEFAPYFHQVAPEMRIVVHSWDVGYLREARGAALLGDLPALRRVAITRRSEVSSYALADVVLAVTDTDRQVIQAGMAAELAARRPPATLSAPPPVVTLPLVHPLAAQVPGFAARKDVVFVGGFKHKPNGDAVHYLAAEIWPLVIARLPGARLFVVGADVPADIRALESDSVRVLGYVADLESLLGKVRVSVAPLRYGSGMKGKISQSLAAGLPVITNSIGAEGMPLEHGRNALIADTAQGLAGAIVTAYTDADVWARLSDGGQALVASLYSDLPVASRLFTALFGRLGAPAPLAELPAPTRAIHQLLAGLDWQVIWHTPTLAQPRYVQAASLDPSLFAAHLAEADLNLELGDLPRAEVAWRRASAIAPGALGVMAVGAELLLRQGRLLEAAVAVERALAMDPRHADAMRVKSLLAFRTGDGKLALDTLTAARKAHPNLYPNDYRIYVTLCELALASGQREAAMRLLTDAVSLASAHGQNADEQRFRQVLEGLLKQQVGPDTAIVHGSPAAPASPENLGAQRMVDIVIPVHGNCALARRCVESVLATAPQAHIIVVDDASPDGEMPTLLVDLERRPQLKVVRLARSGGFVVACHAGAGAGSGELILFLNSDVEAPAAGWLEALIPTDPEVAITGARLLFPPDKAGRLAGTIQHAGVARNADGLPDHPLYGLPADHPLAVRAHDVNAVTGACLLIRRAAWDALGGFDRAFGSGLYEDVDLCWRARKRGWRVRYEPAATLYHHEHGSLSEGRTLHAANLENNRNLLLERWGRLPSDEELFYPDKAALLAALKQRAMRLASSGDPRGAERAFVQALEQAPEDVDMLVSLGKLCYDARRYQEAASYLERAAVISPADSDVRSGLQKVHERLAEQPAAQVESDLPTRLRKMTGRSAPVPQPEIEAAATLLGAILQSEDPLAVVADRLDQVDDVLLALLLLNRDQASADGNRELAEALDGLYQDVLRQLPSAQATDAPGAAKLADHFRNLTGRVTPLLAAEVEAATRLLTDVLSSGDPESLLRERRGEVTSVFLALVQVNRDQAAEDGRLDLRDALNGLYLYGAALAAGKPGEPHSGMGAAGKPAVTERGGRSVRGVRQARRGDRPRILFLGGPEVSRPYRLEHPAQALAELGYQVEVSAAFAPAVVAAFDLLVFSRVLDARVLDIMRFAKDQAKRVVLDLDDCFHCLPPEHPGYASVGPGNSRALAVLDEAIALADVLTVATPELAKLYGPQGKRVAVLPNCWNKSNIAWSQAAPARQTVNVGWAGTITHRQDVEEMWAGVSQALSESPQSHLVIGGDRAVYELFSELPEGRRTFLPMVPFGEYPALLASYDIFLAPLTQNQFNRAKSDVKLLEAGARGIPWIASPLPSYRAWGTGGILVRRVEDWHADLVRLLADEPLRKRLGAAGRAQAELREIRACVGLWADLYDDLMPRGS